jgi:hypothetical protein
MGRDVVSSHVLREFGVEIRIVRNQVVGCSQAIREFEYRILTVGNPYRNGRRERI